jgi:hypothetical protein
LFWKNIKKLLWQLLISGCHLSQVGKKRLHVRIYVRNDPRRILSCWGIGKKPFTFETSKLLNSWIYSWMCLRVENSVSWQGNVHEDIQINFTQFANLLMLCEIIAELALVRRSAFCFKMIGIRRNSGDQEPVNFRNLEESQFRNLDRWWSSRMKLRRSSKGQVKDVTSKVRVWSVN